MNNQDNDLETNFFLPARISSRMQDNLLLMLFIVVMAIVSGVSEYV
jgi:hypothetical protein